MECATWYAFCMIFHARWIFLTTTLRIPPKSRSDESGIRRGWVTGEKSISHGKPYKMHFLAYFYTLFNQAKYNVQSCRSWKPCEMDLWHHLISQLFSALGGGGGGRSELRTSQKYICEKRLFPEYLGCLRHYGRTPCRNRNMPIIQHTGLTACVIIRCFTTVIYGCKTSDYHTSG